MIKRYVRHFKEDDSAKDSLAVAHYLSDQIFKSKNEIEQSIMFDKEEMECNFSFSMPIDIFALMLQELSSDAKVMSLNGAGLARYFDINRKTLHKEVALWIEDEFMSSNIVRRILKDQGVKLDMGETYVEIDLKGGSMLFTVKMHLSYGR